MTKVKTYIAQTMRANAINIFEIDESLETFSADIQQRLIPDFLDYGVQLKRFYVTTVVKPDGDPQYEKFKELHFRQYADIAEAKLKQQTDVIHRLLDDRQFRMHGLGRNSSVQPIPSDCPL